jgi:hypothetical protein
VRKRARRDADRLETDAVEPLREIDQAGNAARADLLDEGTNLLDGMLDVQGRPRNHAPQCPCSQCLSAQVESPHHGVQSRRPRDP